MIKNRNFRQNWVNFSHFRENRASRRPYKALQNLESRDTALFAILYYRGSGEPTKAFCLCLGVKIGFGKAKMGIFRAIFCAFGVKLDDFGVIFSVFRQIYTSRTK